ncbi:PP0621 family protein [Aidingimonas lacisalsi]|uniref:PP0621 family protein n=1 Tax=Aidingimonas lacisalsi TaxID=2604086 RepID=UPI0011D23DFC|nr:PP0621 family protein [Aidingimonas lacisalsi]
MNLLIIRLIIFAILFFAGLKLYRMYREWRLEHDESSGSERSKDGNHMVRCSYCRVHLPEDDALRDHGEWFCCTDHRDKYLEEQRPEE